MSRRMQADVPIFDGRWAIELNRQSTIGHRQLPHSRRLIYFRRGATPGPFFLTLGLREPRGSVRFGLAACFLRAARFSFLRSSLSLMFFVFMRLADS